MKKSLKRMISAVVSAAMVISSLTVMNVTAGAAEMSLTGAGWFESVYAEWLPVDGVAYYEAEIKSSDAADTEYETVDDELIRQYDKFNRVDVVGLKAGSYDLKVTAYDESGAAIASDTKTYEAKAYDRSGAAFSTKNNVTSAGNYSTEGIGAYKMDGTLKDGAKVFYVTPETAKTIATDVITSSKGKKERFVGIQAIIDSYKKGYDTTPLDFRIVGLISRDDLDSYLSSEEGLQVKGKSNYSQLNITIEGIGNDAAVTGFGFLIRNAASVEFRNFAILNFMDDGISIDTANSNLWIHNMDLFYGGPGGDSDQAKGDGSVDIKGKSTNITVSYNHFWDSGKSSLCGMGDKETADSLITYHHNWFDHSDSRHPRVRAMSVHIYNNYFDGNAKYGSASANDASLFVQNNYYRSCKIPVITGGQGHEIGSDGKGTLSGETGSPIKLSGNIMTGTYNYTDYKDSKNNFDGVKVDSADEKLDSGIKTVDGSSYNNFDTDTSKFDLAVKDLDNASDVPSKVMANAGRCQGGDIFHTFTTADDADYSVNSTLKNKVIGYTSSVKVVGGTVKAGATNPGNTDAKDPSTTDPDYSDRDENNQEQGGELGGKPDEGSQNPGGTGDAGSDGGEENNPLDPPEEVPDDDTPPTTPTEGSVLIYNHGTGENTLNAIIGGSDKKESATLPDGTSIAKALKMDSKGSVSFTLTSNGKMTMYTTAKSDGAKLNFKGDNGTSEVITLPKAMTATERDLTPGTYTITKNATESYLYYIKVVVGEGGSTDPTDPPVTEPSYEGTTLEISEVVTENTDGKDSANITYPKNADGSYSINDEDTTLAGNLVFPFEPQSKGKVVISGNFTPGSANSGWSLVQIVGKKTADAAELSDLFDFRAISDSDISDKGAIGSKGNYNFRITETYKVGLDASVSTSKTEYQFVIDLTNKTVKATIGGKSTEEIPFGDVSVDSISGVKFMTAGTAKRTITMSVPEVLIVNEGEPVDPDPDNPDKPDPDDPDKPDPDKPVITADGDADNNGALTANDAAVALLLSKQADFAAAKTLADSKNWSAEKADVDGNGQITVGDISQIMAKVLDSSKTFTKA